MMKIRFFEVIMAIEMCKILELKGERPGKPSVLGGCCLRAGRFVCVLSPTSHCLFANSLKNWTRSLIGARRGSRSSGICVQYAHRPVPPLQLSHGSALLWSGNNQRITHSFHQRKRKNYINYTIKTALFANPLLTFFILYMFDLEPEVSSA